MKRVIQLLIGVQALSLLLGCNFNNENYAVNENVTLENVDGSIVYYQSDEKENFLAFLNMSSSDRAADNNAEYAELWNSLTEEQKTEVMSDLDGLEVTKKYFVTDAIAGGRGAVDADSCDERLMSVAKLMGFEKWVKDNSSELEIDSSILEEFIKPEDEDVSFISSTERCSLSDAIVLLTLTENWKGLDKILSEVDAGISVDELRNWEKIISESTSDRNIAPARSSVDWKDEVLIEKMGEQLKNGDVLLTKSRDNPYGLGKDIGYWTHAGIFSEQLYSLNPSDSTHCVYTAQPKKAKNYCDELKPDRTGMACLDNILMYTRQLAVCAIRPIDYSEEKATVAVKYAKEHFYDRNIKYHLPVNEFLNIFDTSHNPDYQNTYCSKVVYCAWLKAGVNLENVKLFGNLISPDNLYSSTIQVSETLYIYHPAFKFLGPIAVVNPGNAEIIVEVKK